MSSSVDNRIVEMEFDNQQFESGVATTMDTLAKFKDALRFDGAEKGLENIGNIAENFDMSGMDEAVENTSSRFSALAEVGVGALRKIGEMAVDTGMSIAKNLANQLIVDPLSQGWSKYESNLKSVQTIMAATNKPIEEVQYYMDKLNWYTDETSYNYSDMANNIAKFTSNGVELDQATSAMFGIANMAGLAGAEVSQASHAMEGFAKAMGMGYMNQQSWSFIKTAGMDTVATKQAFIDAAVELNQLRKVGEDTYETMDGKYSVSAENFLEAMGKAKWINSDVIMSALTRMGSSAEAIYDIAQRTGLTASEIIPRLDEFGVEVDEVALKAFKAGQEYRTFTDAIEATKDAVSTGWMNTFRLLLGNYEEAKDLWTSLGNTLYDVFAESGNIRNAVLEQWSTMGGRDILLEGFYNIGNGIMNAFQPVRDMFASLFGFSGDEDLYEEEIFRIAEGFLHITESFRNLTEVPLNIGNIVEGIVAPFKFLLELGKNLVYAFSPLGTVLVSLLSVITNAAGGLGILSSKFFELAGSLVNSSNIFRIIHKLLTYIIEAGKTVIGGIGRAISESEALGGIFETVSTAFGKLKDFLHDLVTFEGLEQWVNNFGLWLAYAAQNIVHFIREAKVIDRIVDFFAPAVDAVMNFAQVIGTAFNNALTKVKEFISGIDFKGKASAAFDFIKGWAVYIYDFIKSLDLLGKATNVFNTIKSAILGVTTTVKDFITRTEAFQKISAWIRPIVDQIKALVKQFGPLKTIGLVIGGIGIAIKDLAVRLYELVTSSGVLEKLSSMFWKVVNSIQAFGTKVYNVALPVIERLKTTFKTAKDAIGMMDLSKYFESLDFSSFKGFTTSVIRNFDAFTKSFAIRFKHLATLRGIADGKSLGTWIKDYFTSLIPKEGLIRDIFDKLTEIKNKIVDFFKGIKEAIVNHDLSGLKDKISSFFTSIGEAVKKMVAFLKDVDLIGLAKGLAEIFLLFSAAKAALNISGVFKSLTGMFDRIGRESFGTQIIKVAIAIGILAASMWALSQIPADKLQGAMRAMGELAAVMVTFTGIMGVMAKFGLGKDFAMGAGGLIGMTIAVGLMVGVIKLIEKSGINFETVISNAESFITVFGLLGALMLVAKIGGKNAWSAGVGLVAMSAAIFILVQDIKAIAKISQGDLDKGTKTIAKLMIIMGLVSVLSRFAGANASKAGSMLLKMSLAIGILVICINALAKIDPTGLKRAETAIIALMGVMGLLMAASKLAENSAMSILAMAVLLGTITAALYVLSQCDWESVRKSAESLSLVAGVLSACLVAIGLWGPDLITAGTAVIAMGAMLLELVAALAVLSLIDSEDNLTNAEALSLLAGVLTAVIAAFGAMGVMAVEGAIAVVASLTILFGGLMGLVEALGYLSQYATHMEEGFEFLNRLAKGIGEFIGNLIGSALESISNSLPTIGENISQFAIKLRPFIGIVSQLPEGFGNKTGELTTAMSKLTDAAIWGNVKTSWFGADMTTFAKNLKDFAVPFREFVSEIAGIEGIDAAAAATTVMESMTAFAKDIPNEGGLISVFTGDNSLSGFADQLPAFGAKFAKYAKQISGVDPETVTASAAAAQSLTELAATVPNEGGWLAMLVGDNSLAGFANQLPVFGANFAKYAKQVKGVDAETATASAAAAKSLTELAVTIPNEGGFLALLVGDNSLAGFANQLPVFGAKFAKYAKQVTGIDPNVVTTSANIAKSLVEFANLVPNRDGLVSIFTGDKSMAVFGEDLAGFGAKFKEFGDSVADVPLGKINAVVKSLDELVNFGIKLNGATGGFGDAYGFDTLLGQMTSIATTAVQALATEFTNSSEQLTTAIVTMLGYITSALSLNQYLVTDQARLLCEAVILQFQTSLPDETFSRIGRGIILAFIDGILRTKQQAIQAATDLANATTEAVRSALPENVWYDIGAMAAQGLANGIRDKMNEVANAAIQAASEAVRAAKETLVVESPSKVFWQIGAYTMEGLANGITDNTSNIGIVADAAAREAINAFSYVASVITAAMDDELNFSPLITPVLDLSNVQAGTETMNSLLGNANIAAGVSVPGYISPNSIAQLTASIEGMAAKMQSQEKPNINIYVTGGDNANASEIADEVINRINIEYQRQRAVWA